MEHHITLPLTREKAAQLHCGDTVLLSGTLYTARDAAHSRMEQLLRQGEPLPIPIKDAVIYYTGPSPAHPGGIIGSAGPTTSYRMDSYTPELLGLGLRGMVGKGARSPEVIAAIQQNKAVYFGAVGGAGALLAGCIKACRVIAFNDLGPEAVHQLEVENFPVVVVIDSTGENLYKTGPASYLAAKQNPPQR